MGGLGGKNRFCLEQLMKSADSLTEREREREETFSDLDLSGSRILD